MTASVFVHSRSAESDVLLRRVLLLAPILAAGGPYLLPLSIGIGQLYAFRLLTLLGLPLVLLTAGRPARAARGVTEVLVLAGAIWILWGLASLIWTPDARAGLVEISSLTLGAAATTVLIAGVEGRPERLQLLAKGWGLAFGMAALVAIWELRTGQHLPSSFAAAQADRDSSVFVSSTFGNPNAFGAFLLMSGAVFLWQAIQGRRWRERLPWLVGIAAAPILMLLAGCRTALVGAVLCAAVCGWTYGSARQRWLAVVGGVLTAILALLVFLRVTGLTFSDFAASWRLAGELEFGGSAAVRLNLFRDGWEMLKATGGMGVGAGGFSHSIEFGYQRFDTAGIVNPHNFWLEIVTQYGLPVLLVVMLCLGWWAVVLAGGLRTSRRHGDQPGRARFAGGMSMLVAYVIAAGANSTFIPQATNWAYLGTLCAVLVTAVIQSAAPREE